jgi:hypothetical protein
MAEKERPGEIEALAASTSARGRTNGEKLSKVRHGGLSITSGVGHFRSAQSLLIRPMLRSCSTSGCMRLIGTVNLVFTLTDSDLKLL